MTTAELYFFFFAVLGFELRVYSFSYSTSPLRDRVSQTICLGWLRTMFLLISASWVARITGVSHCRPAMVELLKGCKSFHSWFWRMFHRKKLNSMLQSICYNYLFCFFGGTGVWIQCFMPARQVLYCLNHTSNSFFSSGYFGDMVSLFAQASLDRDPPILGFPMSLVWEEHCTTSSFFPLR
jgi:hypothetical protein